MKYYQFAAGLLFVLLFSGCSAGVENSTLIEGIDPTISISPTPAPPPTSTPLPSPTSIPFELTVQVTDEDGNSIRNALVTIEEQQDTQQTDTNGEAYWTNLPADSVLLDVYHQGYALATQSISLERGSNFVEIQLVIDPQGLQFSDVAGEGEELLFIEDFQDGKDGFRELVGNWEIIEAEDSPGNQVMQIDQKVNPVDFAYLGFGPDELLESFTVEYKFRFLEVSPFTGSEWQSVGFQFWNRYAVDLYPVNNGMFQLLDFGVNPWEFPVQVNRYFQPGRWYTVRVEIDYPEVNFYLDGNRLTRYQNLNEPIEDDPNFFVLYTLPHCVAQVDDVFLLIPTH